MLELYQFELSQYCEKVRLILDYKGLEYQKIEVIPGIGQVEVYRLSGQGKVPVLKDGQTVIADSTEIAFYLDRKYPEKLLLPTDGGARGATLLLEEWADEFLGKKSRLPFLDSIKQDSSIRSALLPSQTPDLLKTLLNSVPSEFLEFLGSGMGINKETISKANRNLRQSLDALTLILESRPYLTGDTPTLADFTVAALSILIKFPAGDYLDIPNQLKGRGIPGLADDLSYAPFFLWRDKLYSDYRKVGTVSSTSSSVPSAIEIE